MEVLEFLTLGLSDKEIAARMGTTGLDRTKKIVRSLLAKLQLANRTQAAVLAARCGLAGDSGPPAAPR
jgi:DNA-binding NarL/FixJ family response regulator